MSRDYTYNIFRGLVSFWVGFFFKDLAMRNLAAMPMKGPLILALNHPNNFLDSVLMAVVVPRKIHFLATGQLFRNRFIAQLLHSLGVIPVYRQEDGSSPEKTQTTFEQVATILKSGGVVALYPEGVTHSDPFLHKIKTGAARMALQAEASSGFTLGLQIMPVGINFLARKSFRQRVTISFGTPLKPFPQPVSDEAQRTAIIELTNQLQTAMEEQLLNSEAQIYHLLQDVEEIYKDHLKKELHLEGHDERAEDFLLSQRIIDAIEFYRKYFPAKFEQLQTSLQNYQRKRNYMHVPEATFRHELKQGFSANGYAAILLEGLLGLPLFLYGALNHLAPYFVPRLLSHFGASKETDYATIRFLASIIGVPLFYALQTALVITRWGYLVGLIYLATLPVAGIYAVRYLYGIHYFQDRIHLLYLFLGKRGKMKRLAQERARLIQQMDEVRMLFLKNEAAPTQIVG